MTEKRFLSEKAAHLLLVPAIAAAALVACQEPEVKHCVDKDGKVVEDSACKDVPIGAAPSETSPRSHFWYYGGTHVFQNGDKVVGGSFYPSSSRRYVTGKSALRSGSSSYTSGIRTQPAPSVARPVSTSVSRGMFGGTGHAVGVSS